MKAFRFLLFPFSICYNLITKVRNYLFDKGMFAASTFDVPIIAVGNLSVGGTGKTPQIEYLIRLLQDHFAIAILSRGYKRSSKGFVLADRYTTMEDLGDEPFQIHQKFSKIQVAVDVNRKDGIEKLLQLGHKPEVILLDDALQHRKVKAGFYILLTVYSDLFTSDFLLPTGNLRESRTGAKRADCVVVTKCPVHLSKIEKQKITTQILNYTKDKNIPIFFSSIAYGKNLYSHSGAISWNFLKDKKLYVLAGIAKPEPFVAKVKEISTDLSLAIFADHHAFTDLELQQISTNLETKTGITTEKDYVRLQHKLQHNNLFYLPIESNFLEGDRPFNDLVLNYINNFLAKK